MVARCLYRCSCCPLCWLCYNISFPALWERTALLQTNPLLVPYLLPRVQFGNWHKQSQEELVLLACHVGFCKSKQPSHLHKEKKSPSCLHLCGEKQGALLAWVLSSDWSQPGLLRCHEPVWKWQNPTLPKIVFRDKDQ